MPEEMTTTAAGVRYDDLVQDDRGGWRRVEWVRSFNGRVQLKTVDGPATWLSPTDEVQVRRGSQATRSLPL